MKNGGRYDRYIATSRKTGFFKISLFKDKERTHKEEYEIHLDVCINCLKALNYDRADDKTHAQRREIRDSFEIGEFFEEYSTYFKEKPKYNSENIKLNNYPENWEEISNDVRERAGWKCAECGVNLQRFREFLQAHHKNKMKFDNNLRNLEALCIICHSEKHSHMSVSNEAKEIIIKQRLKQDLD